MPVERGRPLYPFLVSSETAAAHVAKPQASPGQNYRIVSLVRQDSLSYSRDCRTTFVDAKRRGLDALVCVCVCTLSARSGTHAAHVCVAELDSRADMYVCMYVDI